MAKAGVRFGTELRKRARGAEEMKSAKYACLKCGKKKVRRKGYAIWKCNACGAVFAGAAYSLTTGAGESARAVLER